MEGLKQQLKQGLVGKSGSMDMSKALKTKQFLNRFNELPSYNAIHSKNHKQSHHQSDHYKIYSKNKTPLLKLKLDASKNSKNTSNMTSSTRQKSQRKRRLLNALMDNHKRLIIGDKYHSSLKKLNFYQRQTIPSANDIFKNMKIKSNIERLSLKINYNYYPANDCDLSIKKHQRFSYAPCGSLDAYQRNKNPHFHKNKQFLQAKQKKVRQSVVPKMTKSFIRLKCIAFNDNDQKNIRCSKITSNLVGSMKNSRVQQINSQYPNIKLKSENRLNLDKESHGHKLQQSTANSMKHLRGKQSKKIVSTIQRISKKINLKSFNKFKIVRTELKESDKQNYEPKMHQSTRNSYIKNYIKTSNLEALNSCDLYQFQQVEYHNYTTQNLNPISLLHPEGQFARHFESQFNPW